MAGSSLIPSILQGHLTKLNVDAGENSIYQGSLPLIPGSSIGKAASYRLLSDVPSLKSHHEEKPDSASFQIFPMD